MVVSGIINCLDYMDSLKIAYESEEYNQGSMNYADFASSLMSFGKTLEIANDILNSSNVKLQIRITSDFQNKCFLCKVTLKAKGLLNNLPLFSGKDEVKEFPIKNLLKVVGFIDSSPLLTAVIGGVMVYLITSFLSYKL